MKRNVVLLLGLLALTCGGCGGSDGSGSQAGKILSDAAHGTAKHTKEVLSEAGRKLSELSHK